MELLEPVGHAVHGSLPPSPQKLTEHVHVVEPVTVLKAPVPHAVQVVAPTVAA
jgi:hypothetical protein